MTLYIDIKYGINRSIILYCINKYDNYINVLNSILLYINLRYICIQGGLCLMNLYPLLLLQFYSFLLLSSLSKEWCLSV